jgi:hypothetical protein
VRPSIKPNASDPRPNTDNTAPNTSTRPGSLGERSRKTSDAAKIRQANGMLMPKAHRHDTCSESHPPNRGPTAAAAPMVDPHTAKAWPRALPVKEAFSNDSEVGRIIAAPAPCTKRAAISRPPVDASPASRLDAPKVTTPVRKTRRAPRMSAMRPTSNSRAASTIA